MASLNIEQIAAMVSRKEPSAEFTKKTLQWRPIVLEEDDRRRFDPTPVTLTLHRVKREIAMQLPNYTIIYSEPSLRGNILQYIDQQTEAHEQHIQQLEALIADYRERAESLLRSREDDDRYRQEHPVLHFLESMADAIFVAPLADRRGKVATSRRRENADSTIDRIMMQVFLAGNHS